MEKFIIMQLKKKTFDCVVKKSKGVREEKAVIR